MNNIKNIKIKYLINFLYLFILFYKIYILLNKGLLSDKNPSRLSLTFKKKIFFVIFI